METRLETAYESIEDAKGKFNAAKKYAKGVLIDILKPVGEHGVTIANIGDNRNEGRVPCAEVDYDKIYPIALVRYWIGNLEVFLTDFDELGNVTDEGNWVDYDSVYVDTWYILDKVEENLEYADGYDYEE